MSLMKFSARLRLAGAVGLALLASAGAPALAQEPKQEPNLWDKTLNMVGLGGKPDAAAVPAQPAAPQVAAPQVPASRAAAPAAGPVMAPVAPSAQSPGVLDNVLGKVGLGGSGGGAIDYSERKKLAVPQQRNLPVPAPDGERRGLVPGDGEALTKPPADHVQKVVGPDGQPVGVGDTGEKKFFGLF
jgi:hypothetical protein